MTHFLKIGKWTFNLDAITRFYDHLPEKNMVEIETQQGWQPGDGGFGVQFWNECADSIRELFADAAGEIINVIDLTPKEIPEPRKTWDGVTLREKHELQNVIGVHEETIATQSKLIAGLRESIADVRKHNGRLSRQLEEKTDEHNAFAAAALSGLSAFGCTPEKGYAKDGGVGLLVVDFRRARKKMADLQESYERVSKANVGLLNQLIDVDCAARKLINGAEWIMGSSLESVQTEDLIALRTAIGELRADRRLGSEESTS